MYIAGRSGANALSAISKIEAIPTDSPGQLTFLLVSLDDLSTIKPAVELFVAKETRLDVLFNNAGVSLPPRGSLSAQGHELHMATNCLGHYLLTQLLLPILLHTVEITESAAVHVVWTSSIAVDGQAPKGGLTISDLANPSPDQQKNYTNSKTGNWFLARSLATQVGSRGILSLTQNPGNLKTALLGHAPWLLGFLASPLLYHLRMGAYMELWAGLSEELEIKDGGKYVVPWGRVYSSPRKDLLEALKGRDEGGTGKAEVFVEWCEEQVRPFR